MPAGQSAGGPTASVSCLKEVHLSRQTAEQVGPVQSLVSTRSNRCYRARRSTALGIHWGANVTVFKGEPHGEL